jgi:hypothetical protein
VALFFYRFKLWLGNTYSQIPLMMSWALTIHKAQGQSLDRVVVDLNNCFGSGMGMQSSMARIVHILTFKFGSLCGAIPSAKL